MAPRPANAVAGNLPMKVPADSVTSPQPDAVALADAALQLLAAFFPDRDALVAFLAHRVTQVPGDCYLAVEPIEFIDASEVLRHWESRAGYLDSRGQPIRLPEEGAVSFATLSREACPSLEPSQVLRVLEEAQAIERTADGLRMTARAALVRHATQAAHGRAARVASRLLRTLRDNLAHGEAGDRLFERSAVVSGIPANQLPAVKAFLARHGQQFLEDADDILARLADPASADTVDAGVGLFLFKEPSRKAR